MPGWVQYDKQTCRCFGGSHFSFIFFVPKRKIPLWQRLFNIQHRKPVVCGDAHPTKVSIRPILAAPPVQQMCLMLWLTIREFSLSRHSSDDIFLPAKAADIYNTESDFLDLFNVTVCAGCSLNELFLFRRKGNRFIYRFKELAFFTVKIDFHPAPHRAHIEIIDVGMPAVKCSIVAGAKALNPLVSYLQLTRGCRAGDKNNKHDNDGMNGFRHGLVSFFWDRLIGAKCFGHNALLGKALRYWALQKRRYPEEMPFCTYKGWS